MPKLFLCLGKIFNFSVHLYKFYFCNTTKSSVTPLSKTEKVSLLLRIFSLFKKNILFTLFHAEAPKRAREATILLRGNKITLKCARLCPSGHAVAPKRAQKATILLRGNKITLKCARLPPSGHTEAPKRAREATILLRGNKITPKRARKAAILLRGNKKNGTP